MMTPDATTKQERPANDIGVMRHAHSPDCLRGLHEGVLLAQGHLENVAGDRLKDKVWLWDAFSELKDTTQRALKSHAVETHARLRRLVLPPKSPNGEGTIAVEVPARLVGAVDAYIAHEDPPWKTRKAFVEDAVTNWLEGNLRVESGYLGIRETEHIENLLEGST